MQANWSLILNVVLLIGVVIAIGRLMKARRQSFSTAVNQQAKPTLGAAAAENRSFDDIIAVRKLTQENASSPEVNEEPEIRKHPVRDVKTPVVRAVVEEKKQPRVKPGKMIMLFLQAKENRQLAGYELLQTVLAAGLRFGEGQLFHRHQQANGQGAVLCSLAAATATGVFDLQNIGAFSVKGLCLFMQTSGEPEVDAERIRAMFETARLLSEGLDARLLDDQQRVLNEEGMARYYQMLNIPEEERDLIELAH
ncbi:cell division protein ZipA [Legionella quinlivanii]|uniref:Cell division protein ZipA n=1 Tax=Legionella quinlivanii TaxID=45073 RepID=A0A0W0Y746_9GAMM|nr:cell division protein ZipA C-terminal FtsZ-binding domain-containing protein [Legionella quinlivanii]KTD52355.1 cell division protein ZipA [Legionella quinlivanii]SEF71677.1 cell division protein ZipA [Legionella quinlivanii DSM 21216]STY12146.1 cell division protein ZipA [Legionella quinlivanii]